MGGTATCANPNECAQTATTQMALPRPNRRRQAVAGEYGVALRDRWPRHQPAPRTSPRKSQARTSPYFRKGVPSQGPRGYNVCGSPWRQPARPWSSERRDPEARHLEDQTVAALPVCRSQSAPGTIVARSWALTARIVAERAATQATADSYSAHIASCAAGSSRVARRDVSHGGPWRAPGAR